MSTLRDIYVPHLDAAITSGRWTPQRKEAAVRLVLAGAMSAEELRTLYRVPPDELASWLKRYRAHGSAGLSLKRLQTLR